MKKRSVAIITAALCVATVTSVAAYNVYQATEAAYKIKMNGADVSIKETPVVINDRTYLPLRTVCEDVLGMQVDWNGDTQTIDLWNITKPNDRGTHEFPVKAGVPVSGTFKDKSGQDVVYSISVQDITRGTAVENELRNYWKKDNEYKTTLKSSYKDKDEREKAYEKEAENKQKYADRLNKYICDMLDLEAVTGLSESAVMSNTSGCNMEFLKVKLQLNIAQSASKFEYKTAVNDFTPYCGEANVNGLQRKYVEYNKINPTVVAQDTYAGKTLLTNGVTEGYMYFAVYKGDATPRVMYKDGQYLALYK